ncbi:hypothetical protein Tco_1106512 [Tanacetum coccineum]
MSLQASFLRQKASDYDNSDPVPPRQMLLLTCREDRLLTTRVRISLQSLLEEYYNLTQQKLVSVVQEIGESCSRDIDITKMHSFHPQVMIIEGPERSSFRNKVHGKSQHIASSTRTTFAISLNDELHQSRQTKRLGTSRQTMWQDDFKDKVVYGRKTKRMKDHTVIGKQKLDFRGGRVRGELSEGCAQVNVDGGHSFKIMRHLHYKDVYLRLQSAIYNIMQPYNIQNNANPY